jgi:hypothetical protein
LTSESDHPTGSRPRLWHHGSGFAPTLQILNDRFFVHGREIVLARVGRFLHRLMKIPINPDMYYDPGVFAFVNDFHCL